jgi:hypothetical protein
VLFTQTRNRVTVISQGLSEFGVHGLHCRVVPTGLQSGQ